MQRLLCGFVLCVGCPSNPLGRAQAFEQAGDLQSAARTYVAVAKADPANLAAWDRAIDIQCKQRIDVGACMGILDLELDLLGNLSRHHDALAEVLEMRARERLKQGFLDAALSDLERATKASPNRASLYVVQAKALSAQGKASEARSVLMRARALDPSNAEASALFAELPSPPEDDFGGGDP